MMLTTSNHAWDPKFCTVSYMNECVEQNSKEARQHHRLGGRV
jgi:hypothetical protein